jgi:hypothetical protein
VSPGRQRSSDTAAPLSRQILYEVLWAEPQGNAYYVLAHRYIAAKLNLLNGAGTTTAVNAAVDWAESFFFSNTSAPPSGELKQQAPQTADVLDRYNNGLAGVAKCSE